MAEIREEVIVDVKIDKADTEKQVDTLTKHITALKTENEGLVKVNKELAIWGKQNSKEYIENAKQIEINKQKISENTSSRKNLITTLRAEDNSIKALQVRNRELVKQRNEISTSTAEGRAEIALLNKQIDANNNLIRANVSALEGQRMNVGNYTDSIKEALANSGEFGAATVAMTDGLTKFLNPLTATIAGLGSLIALYAKSTTGARDFAFAQDRLSNITDQLVESFGRLVGGTGGGGSGQGPFSKLIDHAFAYIRLSTPLSLVFAKQIKDLEETSRTAAKAAETLRELEISRRFLQGDFKESERQAELQRRIRDDTTRTMEERIAAADMIERIMAAAGQRSTVVIQAQIDAIKESTVNYENNREAQLRVAELMSEIADVQEDVVGKTTENVMAVQALRKEYEELQKTLSEEARESRLLQYQEYLDREHELFLEAQRKRDEARKIEEEAFKNFNIRLVSETKARIDQQTKEEKKAAQQHRIIERMKVEATVGGLELVTKERSQARIIGNAIFKQDAIKETTTNTYAAAVAAYKSLASIPVVGPVLGAVAAAAATAFGFAQIASMTGIQFADGGKVPGFASGGLSGTKIMNHHGTPINRSNGDNRLATVKTGEVILNERQQAALGGDRTFRSIGVPGFADGGFTGFTETAAANRRIDQAIDARNLASLINQIKVVQVLQDFETAQAAKNEPIIRARVI